MRKATFSRMEPLDYSMREAVNTLCTNLTFAGTDMKKLVVTSCRASEGKSYLVMQIGMNLCRMGRRVVVVDADLRRSNIVSQYGMNADGEIMGLAHYLAGYCEMDSVLFRTNSAGLCIIPAGRDVVNPLPLLNAERMPLLLDELTQYFDIVLVDAPPIGAVVDAAVIARMCDNAMFVVEYNKTCRRELIEAKYQMEQAGTPVLGCVLNKVAFDTLSAKKYYGKEYYSRTSRAEVKKVEP